MIISRDQEEFFDFYYWYEKNRSLGRANSIVYIGKGKNENENKYLVFADEIQKQHIFMQYEMWKRQQEALSKKQEAEQIENVKKVASEAITDVFKNFKFK